MASDTAGRLALFLKTGFSRSGEIKPGERLRSPSVWELRPALKKNGLCNPPRLLQIK